MWAYLPEPLSLVVKRAGVAPVGGLVELGEQGLAGLLAGVVGKLHSNRFRSTAGLLAIQPFDGFFCLDPFIKADESYPSGHSWRKRKSLHKEGTNQTAKYLRKDMSWAPWTFCGESAHQWVQG